MPPLKAHVHNGRLLLDEPTDLPEGEVIYLRPAEAAVGDGDGFDEGEQAALFSALDDGISAARRGEHGDAELLVEELLSQK